jgi:hypothetical protein
MDQRRDFNEFAGAFEKKLAFVVPQNISQEPYCQKYLSYLIQHKKYFLAIYSDVLNKLVEHSAISKENISMIDFGAGNGLLGIYAKFCGVGKVFINDIDGKFVTASEKLAANLDIKMDGFIKGDINEVELYFKNKMPVSIVGTDVIEHIYNLEDFFKAIQRMNPEMVSVLTTASNPCNYFKVNQLKRIQIRDELTGGTPDDHILFGESSHEPYLKIREGIIRKYAEKFSFAETLELAKATRGLNEQDIINAVDHYNATGLLPVPATGKNTCNPLNGSWTERLLPIDSYISLYAEAGFTCKIYPGFYNDFEKGYKNFVKKLLNRAILFFGKKISPYIVIVGSRQ